MTLDEELKVYVKVATTKEDLGHCARIRYTVFGDELGLLDKKDYPAMREIDGFDVRDTTLDLLAFYEDEPVATVRTLFYNEEVAKLNDGWLFGFGMEKSFDLSSIYGEYKQNIAEIPRSSCLKKYRGICGKNNIIMNLWAAAIQLALKRDVTHYIAVSSAGTDDIKEAKIIYELARRNGSILPKYNILSRENHENLQPKYRVYDIALVNKVNFDDLENEDLNNFTLPNPAKIFLWSGMKYSGMPVFFKEFKMCAVPILWDLTNIPEEPAKRFFRYVDIRD